MLDLGCGDGALTAELVEAGCEVVGIDSEPSMVEAARRRGIDARLADVRSFDLDGGFDLVLSNAVLHWVDDHRAVYERVAAHLRPGGRVVAELGGFGNVAAVRVAAAAALTVEGGGSLPAWSFPTPDAHRSVLEDAGLEVTDLELEPRPTFLEAGMAAWVETFCGAALEPLDEPGRGRVLQRVEEALRPVLWDPDTGWWADYVRLRSRAILTSG